MPHTNGFNNGIPVRERVVPGLAPSEPKDEKKTRSRKKKEKAAAAAADQPDGVPATASVTAPPAAETTTPAVETSEVNAEDQKKIRALLKKLRAIEELKLRQAGGEKLDLFRGDPRFAGHEASIQYLARLRCVREKNQQEQPSHLLRSSELNAGELHSHREVGRPLSFP